MIGRLSPVARSRQLDPTAPTGPEREPARDATTQPGREAGPGAPPPGPIPPPGAGPPPPGLGAPPPPIPPPPGIREQIGRLRAAVMGLVAAHRELAKAELGEILAEIKGIALLSGVAIGALVLAGLMFGVGIFLFLGEWLFGSIGWGVLHGPLFLIGLAVAAVLAALGYGGGRIGLNVGLAILLGIAVGVVLGLDLTHRGWSALGNSIAIGVPAELRAVAVAAATLGLLGGLAGLVAGARSGMGAAFGGFLAGAVVGGLLGAITGIPVGLQVGAAIGVTVALIAWPVLMGIGVARAGVDTEALMDRFYPRATIETTKETIEWVRKRTPLGPAS
ncbi:MAG TPA: hypothetical protein VGQ58_12375 [Candidatus Limnocylindrales bacterium]|jgi:hypothetical protein|nr:hypothetical protein [Candidatus Limnocylindrales bacterium]